MKRGLTILAPALAAVALVGGCPKGEPADNARTRLLCGTYPIWLFARAVAAGRQGGSVALMFPARMGCPHDYAGLTSGDMKKIAGAGVFVANGLGMEAFLGGPLERANPGIVVVDSSRGLTGLIPMLEEPGEAHHHGQMNPHLFASPRMAARVVRNIGEQLAGIDPEAAELYRRNAKAYAEKLDALADEFAADAAGWPARKIVTEHAVFDYLARDAGLQIVAVVEETPGQEPSAAGMRKIVDEIKASGAAAVFTEPQYPAQVGRTIAREAGVPVAVLDPVATGPEDAGPEYYVETMRANLATLRKTLGGRGK